jgi:ABC-type dipeptide/oligopeptide/nickel transport system permease subunit
VGTPSGRVLGTKLGLFIAALAAVIALMPGTTTGCLAPVLPVAVEGNASTFEVEATGDGPPGA